MLNMRKRFIYAFRMHFTIPRIYSNGKWALKVTNFLEIESAV